MVWRTSFLCWAETLRKLLTLVSESTTIGSRSLEFLNHAWGWQFIELDTAISVNLLWVDGEPIKTLTRALKVCIFCSIRSSIMVESSLTLTSRPSIKSTFFNEQLNFFIFREAFSYHSDGNTSWSAEDCSAQWYNIEFDCKAPNLVLLRCFRREMKNNLCKCLHAIIRTRTSLHEFTPYWNSEL